MTIVVVMSLLSASGWGLATYLLAMRRQDRRRDEFRQVEATHRGNNHPGLHIVRSVPIGSEVGNDDITRVGSTPTSS